MQIRVRPAFVRPGGTQLSGLLARLLWGARTALTGLLLSGVGLLLLPRAAWLLARLIRCVLSWLVCHTMTS